MFREKAVEDYRTPRRFATNRAAGNSARSWTAPVLWRFDHRREMDNGRNLRRKQTAESAPSLRSRYLTNSNGSTSSKKPTPKGDLLTEFRWIWPSVI